MLSAHQQMKRLGTVFASAQTPACANAQMGSLAHAKVSSQRVGGAMEIYMYIGLGTVLIIIVLFLLLH
jgi:hypothetical protein